MNKILLVLLTITVSCSIVAGQVRQKLKSVERANCSLGLKAAPTIKNVRLGMLSSEFEELFPLADKTLSEGNNSEYLFVGNEENGFGGFDISLASFFNDKLYFLSVSYDDFTPANINDFVRQAASKFSLPTSGWKSETKTSKTLSCAEFSVTLQTGNEGYKQEPVSIILKDVKVIAAIKQREKAKERNSYQESKRENRERQIFKP